MEDFLATFTAVRPRLFGIAYRMLGSAPDAEDLVQDAWVRWQTCDRAAVAHPPAFLATTVTRLAINALRSARARREMCAVPPDPDPGLVFERRAEIRQALQVLTPVQRSAFVLREGFGYSYPEIAELLDTNAAAVRQHVCRARYRLSHSR